MRTWKFGEVCEHGALGRQCLTCEQADEIAEQAARIRDLEARLAACVGALEPLLQSYGSKKHLEGCVGTIPRLGGLCGVGVYRCACGLLDEPEVAAAQAALSSPDLTCWREMIEALREAEDLSHGHDIDLESAGRYHFEEALGKVMDAARRCGLGGER